MEKANNEKWKHTERKGAFLARRYLSATWVFEAQGCRARLSPAPYLSTARQEPSPTSGHLTSRRAIWSPRTRKVAPEPQGGLGWSRAHPMRPTRTVSASSRPALFERPNPFVGAEGPVAVFKTSPARELELELTQSHMAQKPVLRGEVGCACVAREVSVARALFSLTRQGCAMVLGGIFCAMGQSSVVRAMRKHAVNFIAGDLAAIKSAQEV